MSLVDTAVVGAQSSVELAALGPGTSLCDNLAYMCGFLAQVQQCMDNLIPMCACEVQCRLCLYVSCIATN